MCVCVCTRAVEGTLKGFDSLVNLVLDDAREYLQGALTHTRATSDVKSVGLTYAATDDNGSQRELGLMVCRGTAVMTVGPPGEEIANPFGEAAADAAAAE